MVSLAAAVTWVCDTQPLIVSYASCRFKYIVALISILKQAT
jgi:hypothetical protein